MPVRRRAALIVAIACLALSGSLRTPAAGADPAEPRRLVTQRVDEARRTVLAGNTHPAAIAANDQGALADSTAVEHMMVLLRRSPEQEQQLRQQIDLLHDPASSQFHQWLSADDYGRRFGAGEADLTQVTGWLEAHGFVVNGIYPNRQLIDFSGTAGQIRAAFATEMHRLLVNGEMHVANMSDPSIPSALAPAIAGVSHLHDFRPRPLARAHPSYTYAGGGGHAVAPADLAVIYNLNPLFQRGISGQGQTIAVVEDSDLFSTADWTRFRQLFGLSSYAGTLNTIHPSGAVACQDPGVTADEGEAIIDVEWASAAAPSAAIQVSACRNFDAAYLNLINAANPPGLISISFGSCEADNGAAYNAQLNAAYQQAVAEGISVFVAAGDSGAAECDFGNTATLGVNVNGLASTAYNVAVGGTSFGDVFAGSTAAYWSASNGATFGTALSYVPEIPWNDTCGSALLALHFGFTAAFGQAGLCNSTFAQQDQLVTLAAGGGGPSACASGATATTDVVGGSCQGYAKPSWQSGLFGNPADGVRDLPDVSLFAGGTAWGDGYLFCDSMQSGQNCNSGPNNFQGLGTSFATPIMAGIQALVNQSQGGKQGNPNVVYYRLAAAEFGAAGSASCDSTLGRGASSGCVFYNVDLGDTDVPCTSTIQCYRPSGAIGVLSLSSGGYQPAFNSGHGWNFATGIGSVNAANLVSSWAGTTPTVTAQSGWWWNPSQSGRGFALELNAAGHVFFGAFLYAGDGSDIWYLSSGQAASTASYAGTLAQFGNGQTLSSAYQPAAQLGTVGPLSLSFSSATAGTLTWSGGTIAIQRFDIVPGGSAAGPAAGMPQTGWWWNPAESGRGYFLEVQNSTLFMSAFMYNAAGQATWYISQGPMTSTAQYQGQLLACSGGQTLTGPYQAPSCAINAGTVQIQFTSQTTASMILPSGTAIPLQRFTF
jgi:subtilase family serine protease